MYPLNSHQITTMVEILYSVSKEFWILPVYKLIYLLTL